jgi:hypothetical protein
VNPLGTPLADTGGNSNSEHFKRSIACLFLSVEIKTNKKGMTSKDLDALEYEIFGDARIEWTGKLAPLRPARARTPSAFVMKILTRPYQIVVRS